MSNLKTLYEKIKAIPSLPKEIETELNPRNGDDVPYIYVDGFSVDIDGEDFYTVSDETDAVEDFAGTEDQIVEFFKGLYDAYIQEEMDESKSNEYYNKGFNLTLATSEGDDDDSEEEEEEV